MQSRCLMHQLCMTSSYRSSQNKECMLCSWSPPSTTSMRTSPSPADGVPTSSSSLKLRTSAIPYSLRHLKSFFARASENGSCWIYLSMYQEHSAFWSSSNGSRRFIERDWAEPDSKTLTTHWCLDLPVSANVSLSWTGGLEVMRIIFRGKVFIANACAFTSVATATASFHEMWRNKQWWRNFPKRNERKRFYSICVYR